MEAENLELKTLLERNSAIQQALVSRPRGRPILSNEDWSLKPKDISALKKSIHQSFIQSQGCTVNARGEVLNSRGEIVYEAGYLQAIKKMLANAKHELSK